jgi:dTDP-4-dehydrorhamnose 3,5-epimerase
VSARFDILSTSIPGLRVLQRKPIGDSRGYLERLFCMDELQALVLGKRIEQINYTLTTSRGTVRGMHFQYPPHAERKFVHCLRGEVFDVAVDLRRDSPTFLRWHAEVLSAVNHQTFVIPEGFAHGLQTLTDNCEMLYFHTVPYRQEAEGGLHPQDPRLAIEWPLPVVGLSARDAAHPWLDTDFAGVMP